MGGRGQSVSGQKQAMIRREQFVDVTANVFIKGRPQRLLSKADAEMVQKEFTDEELAIVESVLNVIKVKYDPMLKNFTAIRFYEDTSDTARSVKFARHKTKPIRYVYLNRALMKNRTDFYKYVKGVAPYKKNPKLHKKYEKEVLAYGEEKFELGSMIYDFMNDKKSKNPRR